MTELLQKLTAPVRRLFHRSPEKGPRLLNIAFIDESSPDQPYVNNPYAPNARVPFSFNWTEVARIPASIEGFSGNEDAQVYIGGKLASILKLTSSSRVLEFGYGSNHYVAEGISSSGATVHLLDFIDRGKKEPKPIPMNVPPKKSRHRVANIFDTYVGDFASALDSGSDLLKAKRFYDTVVVNGAMVAGGNNLTVHEHAAALYVERNRDINPQFDSLEYLRFLNDYIEKIFTNAKGLLKPGGSFVISSSRYAYHGAGYPLDQLPQEKLEFISLIAQAMTHGAKKMTILGVSSDGLKKTLAVNLDGPNASQALERGALLSLLIGDGPNGPQFRLYDDDRRYTFDEVMQMIKDDERRQQILDNSEVSQLVKEHVLKRKTRAQEIIDQLTGGVSSLPEDSNQYTLSPDTIRTIKAKTFAHVPSSIGRIDSMIIQF